MRNLGSSIGIAITAALLDSNTQINHAIISAAVTPFNRLLQSGAPLRFWNPASTQGVSTLNFVIIRKVSMIAYIDDFKLMLVLMVFSAPLVLLIQTRKRAALTAGLPVE
jgi:DHA2 family multidrug resistance protein